MKTYTKILLFTLIFIFVDQISKGIINLYMNVGESINIIPSFFSLTYVQNNGAAFSILQNQRLLLIIISLIALNIIFIFFIKDKLLKKSEIFIYSLLLGGIVGNLIDRVFLGYVIDFLSFSIFGYDFAIFNLADSFIVIAACLIFIFMMGDKSGTHSNERK